MDLCTVMVVMVTVKNVSLGEIFFFLGWFDTWYFFFFSITFDIVDVSLMYWLERQTNVCGNNKEWQIKAYLHVAILAWHSHTNIADLKSYNNVEANRLFWCKYRGKGRSQWGLYSPDKTCNLTNSGYRISEKLIRKINQYKLFQV